MRTNITAPESRATCVAFLHIALHGPWEQILAEQMKAFRSCGLYAKLDELFMSVVGPNQAAFAFQDPKVRVVARNDDFHAYEFPTLERLHDYCSCSPTPDRLRVLYLHSKGAFRDTPQTRDWRRYMEHFVIDRHETCLNALRDHDVCGVDWTTHPWPHFSGNFWWARGDYVRSLPAPRNLPPGFRLEANDRHDAERWIGFGKDVRAACLHHSHRNLYDTSLSRNEYVRESAGNDS